MNKTIKTSPVREVFRLVFAENSENEDQFALMVVNLRKYVAKINIETNFLNKIKWTEFLP